MSAKYALIIANTEYSDPHLAQLSAPGKDAEEFARVLEDKEIGAFNDVKVLLNHTDSSVREAIDEFFDQKKTDDLLLLYFSGHGIRDEMGALYLAVKNTSRARIRSTAIKSDFVRETMDQSRSKRVVLILDCCNSGAFAQGTKAITGGSIGTASAFEGTGYGRIVLTASDSTQFAWEGDQVIGGETKNSLFTHFLVQGLDGEADRDGDGRITVDELYDFAYEQIVLRTPKQTPGKWSYKQQGEIVLRQSTRIENIRPISLPTEIIEAIEDSRTFVREGAVKQLDILLKGKNPGLSRSARGALEKIAAEDDSRHIVLIASQALEVVHQAEQLEAKKVEEERTSKEEKRLALKKEEVIRNVIEKVNRPVEKEGKPPLHKITTMGSKFYLELKKITWNRFSISAIITILVICGIFGFVYLGSIAPDTSSITPSSMISTIYTATESSCSRRSTSFSRDENIYICVDLAFAHSNTQFESRWYYQTYIFGKELHFQITKLTSIIDNSNQLIYFYLNNPGINGSYRVDIYRNQKLVGTRNFYIGK